MGKIYSLLIASALILLSISFSGKVQAQCATTITSFPFQESFESGFGTLWTGDLAAGVGSTFPGWQTDNNGTPSANTGPSVAQDGNFYAYTEATNGTTGQVWNLNSPCFAFPVSSAPYISFYNHMLTASGVVGMGYLYLQISTNPTAPTPSWTTLFSDSGDNGDVWVQHLIDLSAYSGQTVQLRFQGVRGNSFQGDRAIDNIIVSSGVDATNSYCTSGSHASATASAIFGIGPYTYNWSNGGNTQTVSNLSVGSYSVTITDAAATSNVVSFSIAPGSIPVVPSSNYSEGWEAGFGDWFNNTTDDDFDWSVNSGTTPTGPTGPTGASEGSNYVYTEASFLSAFDQAILNSPCFDIDGSELPYLVFDYNMRVQGGGGSAADMGILWLVADITPQTLGDADTIWTQVGASGNNWLTDSVDLSSYAGQHVTLRFVGQLSNGIVQYGDRAVDNLRVKSGVAIQDACAGTNTGSITLDPQFGNGPYTYSWNTGAVSNPYGSLGVGSYTVTITNSTGVTQSYTYTVGTQVIPTPTGISATLGNYCENNLQNTTLSINYIAGDAVFNGTSAISNDLGPNGTVGTAVNYSINSTPPFATGPGTITFFYRGDIEAPGEFVNVISETGSAIGTANVPATQCNANFVQETFSVTVDSINAWASNGSIAFVGSPFGMTRYCGTGPNRYSQEGQVSITYPYSTNKPYWFANSCDNVIANAVDSGFVVTLSPATTTTYYVRYYNTFCQTWGACESITITVNPKPNISITPPNPSYCSTPTALTASGASTYSWSPGTGLNTTTGATVLASPATTTNYQVIGTDANTCSDTTNITVTVTVGPSVSINSTNPTCNGGNTGTATAIASGGTGAYTYTWSNGATSASISGLSAGTYSVTVNDGTTCTAVQSAVIADPAPLSITIAGNNIGCSGFNSGSAFAFVTGGTPAYSYLWSNGSTTNVAFALAAGTYTLTVTDANGCSNTQSVTITQPAAPLTSSITSSTNVSCFGGNNGSATAAGAGGTPAYSYAWSSGANTATASNLTAGTYICTVSDINGCVSVAIATITQPATAVSVAVTSSTNVVCNGGNNGSATALGSGGTGAITYAWSNGATTATATGLTAGTYTVTATDANGCTATDNVTITEPTPVTATFAVTNVSCFGGNNGALSATGSGGNGGAYTFLWNTGATSASISGLTAGTYSVTITDNSGCTGVATQAITEPAQLVAAIALGNNVSCNGGSDGSATASATGGTTAYSFAWSNGATTAAVTGLAAGTYTVTVTDANLCTDTETITITEPTPVVAATVLNNNVSCFGGNDGSATASATGGTGPYTFAWSNGGTAATVSNLTAGTFTVTATDANGCTDTETITITQPATAVTAAIALGNNVSCAGGTDGAATASASGGTAPYNFAWSNGTTTATATGLAAGTYTVTATDANLCTDTETITITEPTSLVAAIALGSNVSCNGGNDGSATASATGGTTAYSFAWSNGATTAAVTGLAAGSYTVTVTDANLCTDTETITITEPAVLVASIALGSNVSCNGGIDGSATASATGGTTAYSFAWSNGATTAAVTGLAAGTYTVTVTDANLCTDTESITITEPTPVVAATALNNNVSCFGGNDGSATASASGGTGPYTFAWSNGGTTATVSNLTAGTFTVTATDANLCTDTETITITQPATAVTAAIALGNNVSCAGGTDGAATASASGGTTPYNFAWSNGTTTATATGLAAGTYTVTATDANLCTDTETITITQPAALVASIALGSNVSCNGGNDGSATASAVGGTTAYSFAWSNGATTAAATGLAAGTYTVTVTDVNLCTDTETITITEPAALVAAIALGSNVSCNGGNDGSATASATGGTTAYSFAWSNGATTAAVTGLAAGTYTVTVTDANLCTDTETITITEPTPVVAATALNNNVSCFGGNDGSATASASGGTAPYSFAWSNGGNTATVTNLTAGTFTVTATDANGCTDTETITITQPATAVTAAIALGNNVSCAGGIDGAATASASGGTAPYTFAWSNGTTTANATGLAAGTYTVTATDANLCTDTETITITEPTPLVAAIALGSNVSCNGGNDGSATASATGGTTAYSFAWSNGATTATATGLAAGTYTVTVTDANLCTDTETITITEPAALVASIALGSNVSCNGGNDGSATASATGGTTAYSFAWSNGATTAAVTGLAAGTYTVTVTDANLCTDTESITITEPTPVVAATALNNNVSCFGGNDGSATASATGGTGPYTFAWSNGGTTATVSNLTAGIFTVTATDANGCTDTETITITQPATAVTAAIALGNNVSCAGGIDGAATASASGGTAPYSFAWSNGATTAAVTGLAAGTYTVTATDANLCTDTETITIIEPLSLEDSVYVINDVSCNGGNDGSAGIIVTGGTPAYSYVWTNGSTTNTATNLSAGTYFVTVTDANGCTRADSVIITEPAILVASIALGSNVSCNGGNDGSATASATGGTTAYSFAWSNGAATATVTGLSAGTYTVTVTDANLCTDTETITITEPTPLVASILSSSNISCFGLFDGSATASAAGGTAPYTFAWSSGASTAIATGLGAGTFTVSVTDANGCVDTETVTITQPTLLVASTALINNVSCNGGSDGSASVSGSGGTPPYSFAWPLGDTTPTVNNLSAGTYVATVTDANGCSDTSSITITEPSILVASASMATQVSCNGGNDGSATASASGGTTPYNFAWSNGATTATATGLVAGTYIVTITDANGCNDTASVQVTEPLPITLTTTTSNVLCFGAANGTASVTASGGTAPFTYLWGTGNTLSTATNLSPGTYGVTVTDANGCTANTSVTITQPALLVATAVVDSNVTCNAGNNGQASVSGVGGTAPYAYAWSNGDLDSIAENLSAGTYTATITDFNGCTSTSSITITEPTLLVLSGTVANNVSCFGGIDGSASVNATGGTSPYTYLWSNGSSNTNLTNLAAGTYTITATDANGCTDTTSITITEPTLLIASTAVTTNVSCNGGNDGAAAALGVGGTAPYTYAWSNGATTASITGLSAGTYTVTITDANGCTDSEPVTITQPTALIASTTLVNNVSCFGGNDGSATASGSGGSAPYSFAWSNGSTTAAATGLSIGSYTVTVTDFNGCTDTASITITEPATLIASASALNNALCSGSASGMALATETGGTAPYTYAWSNATTMDTAINLAAGTYFVTITDANGCFDSASVTILEPSSVVANAILISDAACNGTSTGSAEGDPTGGTAPYTYLWSNGAGTDTINNLSAGSYILTVTDANGCTGTDTVVIAEPAVLVIAVDSINDVSCNAGNDGFITTSTSGGTAPYSYLWNNSATTDSIGGLSAGSYTVTVTDANGCTAAINPIVQEPSVLTSSISISDVSCNGGNDGYAIANGNGGTAPYTYAWTTGSAIDSTGGLSIGSYIVTITDDNGCFTIDTAVISEPTTLVASIISTDSVNCAGDSTGSAIAGAIGGIMPYSYAWPAAVGTATDSLLASIPVGTYTVTVTDANGCIDSAIATVDEYPAITLTIDSTLDVTCTGGNDGYASVVASGGAGGYTYFWSNGATGMNTDTLMAGSQCVTVTDANGCSETICTTLNETFSLPVVDLGNDTLLCDTIFTITSSNAVSYAWNTLENTQSIDVQTSGTYTVTVTDSNGCENSDDIVVNFNPYLDFEIDTDSTLCASATGSASIVNLTGGGGYNVNWSNGQIGGITASSLAYGAYSVSITDANGCQATESFFIYNDTDLEFALSAIDVSCFGANDGQASVAIVNGTAPFTYNWSNGTSNDTSSNLMGGTYSVTVSDSNGCEVIDSIAISEPDQVTYSIVTSDANCGAIDGFAAVTNVSPSGFYTYAWNDPSSQTTDTASALGAGVYQVTVTTANGCADSSIAIVSNINAPTLAMSAIDETCEGSENGSAIVTATSTSPLTYMWSDALMQTTDTASGLGAGLYFVTVTDTFGCIGIDTVTLNTLSPLPMPNLGSDSLVCESSFVLTPGAGFTSYLWSDGSNSDTLNIMASGTYSVTVTNAGGCENADSVDITLSTPIAFTSTINNSSCSQNTGSVTLVTSGGTGTIEYSWSTGDTLAFISNVGAGNYLVTINDSVGCSVEADFNVDNINAPVVTISTTDLSCFEDNSGTASSSITGGTAPFTYAWSNGANGATVNGLAAGNYDLTVVDDSGCVVIEPFAITEPSEINVAISFVQPTCGDTNGSALATVTNTQGPVVSYLWNDPSNTTIADLDPIPAGFYTVTVTDSAGCQAVENVAISNLGAAILATTATDNNCSNDNDAFATVTAIGGAPFTYEWNDALAQTGDTAFNLFNGTYAVSVTDTAGCIAVDAVTIGSSFDAPALELGNNINACIGSEVILTAGGGYASYFWTTGATTPSIIATLSQTYELTVSNAAGCFNSDTVNVQFVAQPTVDLGPDTIVCIDDFSPTITLDAGEGFNFYEWSTNDTTQTIDVTTDGAYSVSVSEFAGCAGSDQIIVVFDTCVNVNVDDIMNAVAPSIAVYPNPNRGLFIIESNGLPLGDYQIRIMNASGQSVMNQQIRITGTAANLTEIDLQTTARGLYMMILEGESVRIDQRVIVQ